MHTQCIEIIECPYAEAVTSFRSGSGMTRSKFNNHDHPRINFRLVSLYTPCR